MTTRTGRMDVRVLHEPNIPASELAKRIAESVDAELAKASERLVRLVGERWTGYAESVVSPAMIYKNVAYEAAPRN